MREQAKKLKKQAKKLLEAIDGKHTVLALLELELALAIAERDGYKKAVEDYKKNAGEANDSTIN